MSLTKLLSSLYRRLPAPYWAQMLAIRAIAPTFLVGVVGVVLNDRNEILLLEHAFHRAHPWGLPGGWLQRDETPKEALKREIHEETGLMINVLDMLLFEPAADSGQLQVSYSCRTKDMAIDKLDDEILCAKWIRPEHRPDEILSFHARSIKRALEITNAGPQRHQ